MTGQLDPQVADVARVGPLREVLRLPSFRRFLAAQFLSAVVNGTMRFVLVWLTLDLTDWTPAVGLVGVALGASALVVAAPAGALSDRTDRRRLFMRLTSVTAVVLGLGTVAVAVDVANVAVVAVLGAALGGLLAAVAPAVQAMVPDLVPRERLMNGVALQFISMNVAMMLGAIAGGAAIAVAGNAGGLALLGTLEAVAVVLMAGVRVPARDRPAPGTRLRADIGEGVRWSLGREPVRSMLTVMVVIGVMWGGVQLLLPDLAKDELGAGALEASLLFAPLGLGMLVTSLLLANRDRLRNRGRMLAACFTANAGPLVVVLGISRSYVLTLVVMAVWGVGGGVVMTVQRTLIQESAPDALMGRVMGLNTLALLGAFPLAAAVAGGLTAVVGTGAALVWMGVGTTVLAAAISLRPAVLRA